MDFTAYCLKVMFFLAASRPQLLIASQMSAELIMPANHVAFVLCYKQLVDSACLP